MLETRDTEAQLMADLPSEPSVVAPFDEFQSGGYPKLANLMATYGEIAIFRRFGTLNTFVLLSLQAELVELEVRLKDELLQCDNSKGTDCTTGRFTTDFWELRHCNNDESERIKGLLSMIQRKLEQYNRMLTEVAKASKLSSPRKADIGFLRGWLQGHRDGEGKNFLDGDERRIWEREFSRDLLVVGDTASEDDIFSRKLSAMFVDAGESLGLRYIKKPVDRSGMVVYSGFKKTMRVVTTAMAAILPAVSILALHYCKTIELRIGVMIIITTVFSILLSVVTSAKRIEVFSATAAFAAVEVVFIGNTELPKG